MKKKLIITFITALAFYSSSAFADIIHVPGDQPTIQAGIDAAVGGDIVIVADGTYVGSGNKDLDFNGKAITVKSENGPENCVIDCQGNGRGFYFHSGETKTSVLSGFTITNGHADYGGAIKCSSSPTINNCRIIGNTAEKSGGGIFFAVWYCTVTNCTVVGNTATWGGAIYSSNAKPLIVNCTLIGNTGTGAIGISSSASDVVPTITNCILWEEPSIFYYSGFPYPVNINYCDLKSTEIEGATIIHSDPLFTDVSGTFPLEWDLHLLPSSPCIDIGDNSASGIPINDFEGDQRISDGDNDGTATVDLGVDEYIGEAQTTVIGTLTLPTAANGKEYIVAVDTDTEGSNGYIGATIGNCSSGTTVDYMINNVPEGTYYVWAVVRLVSDHDSPAAYGDYIGFYGTGLNPPSSANAIVPDSGTVTFDITLAILTQDFTYMLEDFEGDFENNAGYGYIPAGWSVSGPQVVTFSQGSDSHHGQFCLHAEAATHQTEYTYLMAEVEGQPGTIADLQIQTKAETSGTAEAKFSVEGAVIPKSSTLFWYDYSSTDWRTVTIEDVEIPESGKFMFYIGLAHTGNSGSSNFDIDCFTSDAFLTLSLPNDTDEGDGGDDNGGDGGGGCFIELLSH